jgi:hypothetical protein
MAFLMLISIFLWMGFIGAISFMEAWLKFKAPGVTVPIGLGIGKLVFNALNKMEWLFSIAIVVGYLFNNSLVNSPGIIWFIIPCIILMVQSFWLLPALDARAKAVIKGETVKPSSLHWYFISAELFKITSLFVLGIQLFKEFGL